MITASDIIAYVTSHLASDDYSIEQREEDCVRITIEDFVGFADDWSEEYRDYTDEDAIDDLFDYLDEHALSGSDPEWRFDGFYVFLAFTSDDI